MHIPKGVYRAREMSVFAWGLPHVTLHRITNRITIGWGSILLSFYLMENLVPLQPFMVIAIDVISNACERSLLKLWEECVGKALLPLLSHLICCSRDFPQIRWTARTPRRAVMIPMLNTVHSMMKAFCSICHGIHEICSSCKIKGNLYIVFIPSEYPQWQGT